MIQKLNPFEILVVLFLKNYGMEFANSWNTLHIPHFSTLTTIYYFFYMDSVLWEKILDLCNKISQMTYENLTKIIRLENTKNPSLARNLDDSDMNDIDSWMGGGTCFSMTWIMYQKFREWGLKPKLLMGHKRKEKNVHCALSLEDFQLESQNLSVNLFLFDPGYLIFEPLKIPKGPPMGIGETLFPLVPNCVKLVRPSLDKLELWTGGAIQNNGTMSAPLKLRFEYDLQGVKEEDFREYWVQSFYKEMMHYPVLNRLDREKGIQYYYQKGNLVIRDRFGSRIEKIEESKQVEKISKIFNLSEELVEKALAILRK